MAGIKDLSKMLSEQLGQPQTVCKKIIENLFDDIKVLMVEEDVQIRGFGVFKSRPILERVTKNPRTGDESVVPDSVRVYLTPSDAIKQYLKENKESSFWDNAREGKGLSEDADAVSLDNEDIIDV